LERGIQERPRVTLCLPEKGGGKELGVRWEKKNHQQTTTYCLEEASIVSIAAKGKWGWLSGKLKKAGGGETGELLHELEENKSGRSLLHPRKGTRNFCEEKGRK